MSEISPVLSASALSVELPYPRPAVGWYATILLAFLYWISVLDRFIISLLVDPIKADLGINDVQFGLLHGLAFLISFTLFGFMFGALADRAERRRLIFAGVMIWSLATAVSGFAQNFWHLLLARGGVGAGESSLNPNATSMISDLFPREKLTSAMAVYSLGSTVGSGTAVALGGAIVYYVSTWGEIVLPVVGYVRPWQAVFLIVGLPGILLSFLIFTIPEPLRRGRSGTMPVGRSWKSTYIDVVKFMGSSPRFFACHYTGFTLGTAVVAGCVAWYPVHMMRTFGWSQAKVGVALGIALMIGGIAGKLICGWAVDSMYRRGFRDAQFRWYAGSLFLATPTGIIATTTGNPWLFLVAISVFVMLITPVNACALSALNLVTPNQMRGTGVAVFTTVAALLGGAGGTVAIPVASGLFGGDSTIGLGMATLIGVACPLGGLALVCGTKAMREAMLAAEKF